MKSILTVVQDKEWNANHREYVIVDLYTLGCRAERSGELGIVTRFIQGSKCVIPV